MADTGAPERPTTNLPRSEGGISDIGSAENALSLGGDLEATTEEHPGEEPIGGSEILGSVKDDGSVVRDEGIDLGKVTEDVPQESVVNTEGNERDQEGNIIGKADLKDSASKAGEEGPFHLKHSGEVTNTAGVTIGNLVNAKPEDLEDKDINDVDSQGNLKTENGSVVGKVDLNEEALKQSENEGLTKKVEGDLGDKLPEVDFSILEGKKINKLGKAVNEKGIPVGQLVEGDVKKLVGKKISQDGKIWNDSGEVIGRAEPLPKDQREGEEDIPSPFEDFPDATVDKSGNVIFEGQIVGKLVEGDKNTLEGKKVDVDGDILDKYGNVIGKAERYTEEPALEPKSEPEIKDLSLLDGKKVNKVGNVVDDDGKLFGRVKEGDLSKLVGKKCDAEGKIWSELGKVIGLVELLSVDERDVALESPFEDFPDATVDSKGNIIFENQVVGRLIEGDPKRLFGKKIDKDGEVLDRIGNVLGKAERWTEPDESAPVEIDRSSLAGKRVNKLGNVVDASGQIFGRLVEGDPKKLAGRMCDKNGNVMSEIGDVIGKAELVPESEREGETTGPFAGFDNPFVTKDGKVTDVRGVVIGRLVHGDVRQLSGKDVDADGDVLDKNGNVIGKAERWEEEEKPVVKHPAAGYKVNKEGNVIDDSGDILAKLTEGDISRCAGCEIDNDGDVINSKGITIGHVTLLKDITPEKPKETPEQLEERKKEEEEEKQKAQDRKLAAQLANIIENSVDKIKPILGLITDSIDSALAQPEDERDEQKLVDTVRPLLEQGNAILQECNGAIRALDPDGRIQANAKHSTSSREASPEEYRVAEQLKELTTNIATTLDQAKKKIAGMPHAKKELNPLWALLADPLGQIIAAVGLLLSGVLGLVGRLLGGLGLGGLLDHLLSGLGIKGILESLGLGMVTKSLTGKK
ncbi:hypothetical protein F5884DRAFT_825110 [Xylogone sp. PMI_703]|nr:hypothetical protein F5884DRAFT_825110 [Xylogone sp. PMI_703]